VRAAEGSLCTDGQHIARRSSVTDFSGHVSRRLFTVDTRPQSLHLLYDTCVTSPADVIAQCDIYRTDGKLGAAIFSVPIVCINDRPSEDYLTVTIAAAVRRLHLLIFVDTVTIVTGPPTHSVGARLALIRSVATDIIRSVVCVSVRLCLCVGHTDALCKNGCTNRHAVFGD